MPQLKPMVSCTASHLPRFCSSKDINAPTGLASRTYCKIKRSTNILEAYSLVSELQTNLSFCWQNIDEEIHNLFQDITDETDKIGIEIKVSRQIGKQNNRCNVPAAKCWRILQAFADDTSIRSYNQRYWQSLLEYARKNCKITLAYSVEFSFNNLIKFNCAVCSERASWFVQRRSPTVKHIFCWISNVD